MSYAIISLGGKQYRVSEGQRLLVDRLATEDGKTFTPDVLLVGGDGAANLAPKDVTVTVKVLGQQRGPKIRIGKYKKRTGYKRHTGFRAALTHIEIESIGGGKKRAAPAKPKVAEAAEPVVEAQLVVGAEGVVETEHVVGAALVAEAEPVAEAKPVRKRAVAKPKPADAATPETTTEDES